MFNTKICGGDRRYPTTSANALANSAVVASRDCRLFGIQGYNSGPDQYIQLFDLAALPANGTTCLLALKVLADSWFEWPFTIGLPMFNGIVLCNSTTNVSKTIGAADVQFLCSYRIR
jgi:hypothetical protein